MKTKKLSINKKTVANFSSKELSKVIGGIMSAEVTCNGGCISYLSYPC